MSESSIALRQAARTKPVVVLKAGRSREHLPLLDDLGEPTLAPDTVFDAALTRAGTVRVRTYTQLFAAARILALGKIPRGNKLAIVPTATFAPLVAAGVCTSTMSALWQWSTSGMSGGLAE